MNPYYDIAIVGGVNALHRHKRPGEPLLPQITNIFHR